LAAALWGCDHHLASLLFHFGSSNRTMVFTGTSMAAPLTIMGA
jgi:hypothetical protein